MRSSTACCRGPPTAPEAWPWSTPAVHHRFTIVDGHRVYDREAARSPVRRARAFTRDLPEARVDLYPGGQFLLESALDEVTTSVRSFLAGALA